MKSGKISAFHFLIAFKCKLVINNYKIIIKSEKAIDNIALLCYHSKVIKQHAVSEDK